MAAGSASRSAARTSVLRREEQVELGDGRADHHQGRGLLGIGIRGGVFEERRQDALSLLKIGQYDLQDAVGAGLRDRVVRGIHGAEGSTREGRP
jgi:hypothetical protein